METGGKLGLSCVLSYLQFQSKEPEESEPRGDSLTDQKQADSVVGSWVWTPGEGGGRDGKLDWRWAEVLS